MTDRTHVIKKNKKKNLLVLRLIIIISVQSLKLQVYFILITEEFNHNISHVFSISN